MIKTKKLFLLFTSSTAILLALFLAGFRLPEDAQMNKLIAMFERYMQALPQEKVYFVYDLFVKGKIDREDLECNWDYWNTFIELAEKNKKTK